MSDKILYKSTLGKEQIKALLPQKIGEFSRKEREFITRESDGDSLWIGVERGDHAGHWFIARLNDCSDGCLIEGEIVYDPDGYTRAGEQKENVFQKIGFWILAALLCVIFFIPIVICLIYEKIKGVKTKEEYLDIFMRDYLNCEKVAERE